MWIKILWEGWFEFVFSMYGLSLSFDAYFLVARRKEAMSVHVR